jgi:hypothetical protein
MNRPILPRRAFLRTAAAGTATLIAGDARMKAAEPGAFAPVPERTEGAGAMAARPVAIEEPFHGAVLHRRHGQTVPEGLRIAVRVRAPAGARVTVQGEVAAKQGDAFVAAAVLREHETDIVAAAEWQGGRAEDRVRVVWDKHSRPRFRFTIDDNSFFLRDIWQKGYGSLFDCFYLKMLRDFHTKYGAKFALNIYFTTADEFDLTKFPDRYRAEWKDNADWLRLTFHAYADQPARPYQDAPVERLLADFDKVVEQIHRFAGPEAYAPTSVIHWGMVRPEAWKALYERGIRVLSGYFRKNEGRWDVNYRLDDVRSEWLSRHDALKDFASGIVFSKMDIVCNTVPLDKIVPTLQAAFDDPNQAEVMDLMTHEQYFWPFYKGHLPDHAQRLDVALRFVTERGYKPVFLHEGFLGGPA